MKFNNRVEREQGMVMLLKVKHLTCWSIPPVEGQLHPGQHQTLTSSSTCRAMQRGQHSHRTIHSLSPCHKKRTCESNHHIAHMDRAFSRGHDRGVDISQHPGRACIPG